MTFPRALVPFLGSWLVLALLLPLPLQAADHLLFVTWDGFRWQELFGGAEETLLNKELGGVADVGALRQAFWRETPEQRREVLLPFLWTVLAKEGQLFGDPTRRAAARITNGLKFSYPGYNEMFVGFADPRIRSNDKFPNPNINVLEYLQRRGEFSGRVAAFATWDVIEFVLNRERSGLTVLTGWQPIVDDPLTPGQVQVNQLVAELPRLWRGNVFDAVTYRAAREHLLRHRPRVLYLGLGETDEWAHSRRYDLYLEAAQRGDRYLRELWELLQSLPEYRGRTHLVITTDHGRGAGREWTDHGAKTVGAEYIWLGMLGPEVPPQGVRADIEITQSQVAATLATLVGVDFTAATPQVAPPIAFREAAVTPPPGDRETGSPRPAPSR